MATSKFDPTKYGAKPFNPTSYGAKRVSDTFPKAEPEPIKRTFLNKVANFIGGEKIAQGVGQGLTLANNARLTDEISASETIQQKQLINAIKKNKEQGKDTTRLENALTALTGGASIGYQAENLLNPAQLTPKQVTGDALQLGTTFAGMAAPAAKTLVTGKGIRAATARLGIKSAEGAAIGYGYDVSGDLKENKTISESLKPGLGTVVGAVTPVVIDVALKPAARFIGRLVKGLSSGLSGVGTRTIDQIIADPKLSRQISKDVASKGNAAVLEKNSKTIINGVSKIRKEASHAFAKGVEQLAKEDINPNTFRQYTQGFLDSSGSYVDKATGQRVLSNVEFSDPKNIKKASDLITKLSDTDLNGKALRKLMDEIDDAAYKTATSDERISFNLFLKNMSGTVKKAITSSTPKLNEINAAYSRDIQLAEAIEGIFSDVEFKNLTELNAVSQKLESLFSQKGLSPDYVDRFLTRIGVGDSLKTSEAVRQISNVVQKSNTKGLSFAEIFQQVTSSVITPEAIKNAAIATGYSEKVISPILKKLAPASRVAFLKLISGIQ